MNKEDRKWQFGSSNQECHSQLRPLPTPDTSHVRRGHGFDSYFPSLPPPLGFTGHSLSVPPTPRTTVKEETEWCAQDTSQSDGGNFFSQNTPLKHEACLVRLPWQLASKSHAMSLWKAEKQMSQVCLPSLSRVSHEGHCRCTWKVWVVWHLMKLVL